MIHRRWAWHSDTQRRVRWHPAEAFPGQRVRSRAVDRCQRDKKAEVVGRLLRRHAHRWELQLATDDLCDIPKRHPRDLVNQDDQVRFDLRTGSGHPGQVHQHLVHRRRHVPQRELRKARRLAGDNPSAQFDTAVADVPARPGDQCVDLGVRPSTERTGCEHGPVIAVAVADGSISTTTS